jgi:ketosteroid isomerase-like protein
MRALSFAIAIVACGFVAACGGGSDPKADEAAIAEQNKALMAAIAAKDAKAATAVYAAEGELHAPNAPKAAGHAALEQYWTQMMGLPNVSLVFTTEKVVFANGGDVAVDIGSYQFSGGGMTDEGKSVVTWVKRDGKWLILTDSFSSNRPLPPPPAAPAAETPAVPPTDGATSPPTTPATPPADAAPSGTPTPTPVTPPN